MILFHCKVQVGCHRYSTLFNRTMYEWNVYYMLQNYCYPHTCAIELVVVGVVTLCTIMHQAIRHNIVQQRANSRLTIRMPQVLVLGETRGQNPPILPHPRLQHALLLRRARQKIDETREQAPLIIRSPSPSPTQQETLTL